MKALSINKCRCRCKGDNLLHIISLFVGLYQINCFNPGIELYKPNQSFICGAIAHTLLVYTYMQCFQLLGSNLVVLNPEILHIQFLRG